MFKKLRFTIIWILAIALLVSFAGCSGNDSDEEENGPSSSANPVPEDLAGNITISAYKNYENDNDLFMFAQAYALQYPSVDVQIDADYSYDEYFAQVALTCYVKIRIQQHRMAEDRNQMNMVFHHIPVSLLYILPGGLFRFRHTAIHHCSVPGGTVCRVVRRHGTPVVRSV